jgi:hypothetical protein
MASPSYSFLYRLVLSDRLARRTTFLRGHRGCWEATSWRPTRMHAGVHWVPCRTHPRLPALDVLRLRDDLCLSWDFMITSCLCFSSRSRTLNSSSSHRSEEAEELVVEGRAGPVTQEAAPDHRSCLPTPLEALSIFWSMQGEEKMTSALFP